MKVLGILFIMIGSMEVGFWYRGRYLRRCNNLKMLQKAMMILEGEISYGRTPLPDAFYEMSRRTEQSVSQFFLAISQRMEKKGKNMDEIWSEALGEVFGSSNRTELSEEDWHDLEELGNTLGYLDCQMQLQSLALYRKRLEQSIQMCEAQKEKRTRLYPALGTIGGMMLCLLLI